MEDSVVRFAWVWLLPGKKLVQDRAEPINIGSVIDGLLATGLLGRQIGWRAQDGAGLGLGALGRGQLRDAEVQHLD